jgi:DNA-binding NtrC family response regulator
MMLQGDQAVGQERQLAYGGPGTPHSQVNLFHARILLIEDDYFLAFDLRNELVRRGAEVIGPFGKLDLARDLAKSVRTVDAAIVDINLNGELSFPLIDDLIKRDIPVIFWTGYAPDVVPYRQRHIAHILKSVTAATIADTLAQLISDKRSAAE